MKNHNSAWLTRTVFPAHERAYRLGRVGQMQRNSERAKQRKFGHIDPVDRHHPEAKPRVSKIVGGFDSQGYPPGAFRRPGERQRRAA